MRLIDADKLKTHLWDMYCQYACNGRDLNKSANLNVAICAVEVQEEIEAIPVIFLIKTQEEYCKRYGEVYKAVVLNLVEDWRKENGKQEKE